MDQEQFLRALQQQLPALRSQGQYTAFQGAFEAFRATVNGVLEGKPELESAGREALEKAMETLRMATHLTVKLQEVPEAATSAASEDFKRPPADFQEYDVQRALLSELQVIETLPGLNEWWVANRARIDLVKSPSLRNPLLDLVREKRIKCPGGQPS